MFRNGMADIGEQNVLFVKEYLKVEGISVISADTGSDHARKVYYIPQNGEVLLKRINRVNSNTIELRETKYLKRARKMNTTAQVELFE
jgi:chemotaxis protein CheD